MGPRSPEVNDGLPAKERLYRGDIGLPRGLCPFSPFLQQSLRMGHRLDNAIALTKSWAGSELIDEATGDSLLSVAEHSAFLSVNSPYVSTTTSLHKAIQFASSWNTRDDGYISIIVPAAERLSVDLHAEHEIARAESEVAIIAQLTPAEILGQITVERLKAILGVTSSFDAAAIDAIEDRLLEYSEPFVPVDDDGPRCSVCRAPFGGYAWRYVRPCRVLLAVEPTTAPPIPVTGYVLARDADFRSMCRAGMSIRCSSCGTFTACQDRVLFQPVRTHILSKDPGKVRVRVTNVSADVVRMVNFQIRLVTGESTHIGWSPGGVLRGELVPWHQLAPGQAVDDDIDLGDADACVEELRVSAVGYENGLGWINVSEGTKTKWKMRLS